MTATGCFFKPGKRPETGGNPGVYFQQNIWLDSESFRITENLLYDPVSRSSIRARYESFDQITGQYMPRDISLVFIDPANRADLSLRYTRTSLNEPVPITFFCSGKVQANDGLTT